jgi:hypothetical protein
MARLWAMREPFIVTGMLSRKVDQISSYNPGNSKPIIETHLHYAYLDLNLSHGNSGSPIVAISESPSPILLKPTRIAGLLYWKETNRFDSRGEYQFLTPGNFLNKSFGGSEMFSN